MKPRAIKELQALATEMVGDSNAPDLFFVTDQGVVVTVTRCFETAYADYHRLAWRWPLVECALENRTIGCLASVEPESDEQGARLIRIDDTDMLKRKAA